MQQQKNQYKQFYYLICLNFIIKSATIFCRKKKQKCNDHALFLQAEISININTVSVYCTNGRAYRIYIMLFTSHPEVYLH